MAELAIGIGVLVVALLWAIVRRLDAIWTLLYDRLPPEPEEEDSDED
jgi:hypothetical protein